MKAIFFLLGCLLAVHAVNGSPVEQKKKRLIKRGSAEPAKWLTSEEVKELQFECPFTKFMDITRYPELDEYHKSPKANTQSIPSSPRFQSVVNRIIPHANETRLEEFIVHFSNYHTRYYESDGGEECEKWLFSEIQSVLENYPGHSQAVEVNHTWRQNSIIVRLEGQDPALKAERVIIGAHIDSLSWEGRFERAPAADDDASGCAVLMETLRLLVQEGFSPKRTVELHWYSAEEMGLWGSGEIARMYRYADVYVAGQLQFDVVGYQAPNISDIAIFTDKEYVSPVVSQFAGLLADEYLDFGRRERDCGWECSDHAVWTLNGFPAGFVGEWDFNDKDCLYHHSINDTINLISLPQVKEFVKMAVGFVVELGEPATDYSA